MSDLKWPSGKPMTRDEQFWFGVSRTADRLGIDMAGIKTWPQLADAVIAAMGGRCSFCERDAAGLGMWAPKDPTLFGSPTMRSMYLSCGSHALEDIEDALAAKAKAS